MPQGGVAPKGWCPFSEKGWNNKGEVFVRAGLEREEEEGKSDRRKLKLKVLCNLPLRKMDVPQMNASTSSQLQPTCMASTRSGVLAGTVESGG